MERRIGSTNLYPTNIKGYSIYRRPTGRFFATKRYQDGKTKSALLYTYEDALEFLDSLPPVLEFQPRRIGDNIF